MVAFGGDLDAVWPSLTLEEQAAVAHDWRGLWAREEQLFAADDAWRSVGFCQGRGAGKTRACAEWLVEEVIAGRAMRIALMAQNEDKTREIMIEGESGLLACSPCWFPAQCERGRVVWPNGAQAFVFTPEVPGDIRGPGFHVAWTTELVSWPASKRDEAWSNIRLTTRLGYARVIWDTTPKARHPIIRDLLARAARDPSRHRVVRGGTRANVANLSLAALQEWEEEWGGTQRGREELLGEFVDSNESSLWRQEWIDRARRDMPTVLKRRILALDPAISRRKGTDRTGIVDLGLGIDGQVFVIADLTDRYAWEVWGALVLDRYLTSECDCIVAERNRGGDAIASNLRACAKERGIRVELVEADAPTRHHGGVVYIKEVHAKRSKEVRAEPVASAYEAGRVSHVRGADLGELEDVMCSWSPDFAAASPDGLDALVHGCFELLSLHRNEVRRDGSAAVRGAVAMMEALKNAPAPRPQSVTFAHLAGMRGTDRI